ncbi:MAG: disulfide bond formation DsbB family protein [Micavibrio sp.]|nr:disulfide bond formation DsbB family protein [Micavibrio sp.]
MAHGRDWSPAGILNKPERCTQAPVGKVESVTVFSDGAGFQIENPQRKEVIVLSTILLFFLRESTIPVNFAAAGGRFHKSPGKLALGFIFEDSPYPRTSIRTIFRGELPPSRRVIMSIQRLLDHAVPASLTIVAVSAAALAGAYFFQFVIGLQPCMLCLYQRAPHALEILLGLGAFLLARKGKAKQAAFVILLCAVVYFAEAVIAFYHAGVEQHWWVSFLEACSNPMLSNNPADLLSVIEKAESVRCDAVPWSLLGISMAGYNALLSLGMFAYTMAAALLITRRANGL